MPLKFLILDPGKEINNLLVPMSNLPYVPLVQFIGNQKIALFKENLTVLVWLNKSLLSV